MNDPALGGLFTLNAQVVEVTGIPQGVEVPFEGLLVVNVALPGEHAGANGVGRDASVAVNDDAHDHLLLGPRRGCNADDCEQET